MTAHELLDELLALGKDSYKKVLLNHGVPEPVFGVKVADMKKIRRRVKTDYRLALDLYDTGVYDAMYLAGLVADDARMTRKDLQRWAERANCYPLSEYTVAWVAAGGRFGREMALKWIDAKKEFVAAAGWATLGCVAAVTDDAGLDLAELRRLLRRVEATIRQQPNRVRHTMNGFVIAAGCHVGGLTGDALRTARAMGKVSVDMGETACKVPDAGDYIRKVQLRGAVGKKRKTVKC